MLDGVIPDSTLNIEKGQISDEGIEMGSVCNCERGKVKNMVRGYTFG